jgi:NDP-sugar pyrophosphorylase family protein
MMPVVILAGGHGTRAKQPINKCFVDVAGKPFILWIMEQIEAQGISNTFVLCRGTGGTLTALREARDQLGERFILLYGDTLLPLNFHHFINQWERTGQPAITAVYDGIDAGVNGFQTHLLDLVDESATDLKELQSELRSRLMIHHYMAPFGWYEVGTPEALAKTREMLGI